MNLKHISFLFAFITAFHISAETVDWDKIEYWSGSGTNKAALIIQFQTPEGQTNPGTIIWGYRWDSRETPTGEDMIRAIAAGSRDLLVLTQFTGGLGSTIGGLGFAKNADELADNLHFDFEHAASDARISFGYFTPNTGMSQTSAPGNSTMDLVAEALEKAKVTHIIDHPLNQSEFGYPAYDYDWWQLNSNYGTDSGMLYWNAGWYRCYWSYWIGEADLGTMSYSGLGMSSVTLNDGDVHGWKNITIDEDDMNSDFFGYLDANSNWRSLNYKHTVPTSSVIETETDSDLPAELYRIDGTKVNGDPVPGLYIRKQGNKVSKIFIK